MFIIIQRNSLQGFSRRLLIISYKSYDSEYNLRIDYENIRVIIVSVYENDL